MDGLEDLVLVFSLICLFQVGLSFFELWPVAILDLITSGLVFKKAKIV